MTLIATPLKLRQTVFDAARQKEDRLGSKNSCDRAYPRSMAKLSKAIATALFQQLTNLSEGELTDGFLNMVFWLATDQ